MRDRFPFFKNNPTVTYLDSAATSQTLDTVIEDTVDFLQNHKSNAHRSGHSMGAWVDNQYWTAKEKIGLWLGITNPENRIIFNSGASQGLYDAIQLATRLDDFSVFIGGDFHHSLSLPFKNTNYKDLKYIDVNNAGVIDTYHLEELLRNDTSKNKIVAVTAVGNITGTVNDLERIRTICKRYNAITILDACQSMGKILHNYDGFDFIAWSWHKIYGPNGLGCLLIDPKWLEYDPVHPGGGSVVHVNYETQEYLSNATKFESGTPNLQAICTLPRLIDWLIENQNNITAHDKELASLANELFDTKLFKSQTGLISLKVENGAIEDITMLLDANNIMSRGGNLCAEPLVKSVTNGKGLLRFSWGAYTSKQELEYAAEKFGEVHERISRFT